MFVSTIKKDKKLPRETKTFEAREWLRDEERRRLESSPEPKKSFHVLADHRCTSEIAKRILFWVKEYFISHGKTCTEVK